MVNDSGGFGGGPQQLSHCAPTYAAVMALATMAPAYPPAMEVLDALRPSLYQHYLALLDADTGGMRVHHEGEVDVRGAYLAMAVADLLGIRTPELGSPSLVQFLLSCQTHEGGFGAEPFNEAHGGYTYCATAALHLLGALEQADVPSLTAWLVQRQMPAEGGFQGRTLKLVDGCYSFWQAAPLHMLPQARAASPEEPPLYNQARLQQYIVHCCQQLKGGLRDKPPL